VTFKFLWYANCGWNMDKEDIKITKIEENLNYEIARRF